MFCQWCDVTPTVVEWSSENIVIPYYDPIQKKKRRYYPDFWVKVIGKAGGYNKYVIEIKPAKECRPPSKRGRRSKATRLFQESTYLTNQAKWKAAQDYCRKMGYEFKLMTEKNLFT